MARPEQTHDVLPGLGTASAGIISQAFGVLSGGQGASGAMFLGCEPSGQDGGGWGIRANRPSHRSLSKLVGGPKVRRANNGVGSGRHKPNHARHSARQAVGTTARAGHRHDTSRDNFPCYGKTWRARCGRNHNDTPCFWRTVGAYAQELRTGTFILSGNGQACHLARRGMRYGDLHRMLASDDDNERASDVYVYTAIGYERSCPLLLGYPG